MHMWYHLFRRILNSIALKLDFFFHFYFSTKKGRIMQVDLLFKANRWQNYFSVLLTPVAVVRMKFWRLSHLPSYWETNYGGFSDCWVYCTSSLCYIYTHRWSDENRGYKLCWILLLLASELSCNIQFRKGAAVGIRRLLAAILFFHFVTVSLMPSQCPENIP